MEGFSYLLSSDLLPFPPVFYVPYVFLMARRSGSSDCSWASILCTFLRGGRVCTGWFLSYSLIIFSLFLFKLCHQPEHIIHPVMPHTGVISAALQYQGQAQALSADRDLESPVILTVLCVGHRTVSRHGFWPCGNHHWVCSSWQKKTTMWVHLRSCEDDCALPHALPEWTAVQTASPHCLICHVLFACLY